MKQRDRKKTKRKTEAEKIGRCVCSSAHQKLEKFRQLSPNELLEVLQSCR